jgi:hypothetical protein
VSRDSLLIPPLNFAMVQKGVYRSGFPNNRNFGFLKQLGIRCIVCLAGEYSPPRPPVRRAYAEQGARAHVSRFLRGTLTPRTPLS